MATGQAGSVARQYHQTMTHFLRKTVNFDDNDAATGVSVGTLPSGAIITGVTASVTTAFNAGTTNVLTVGVSGTLDKYAAAGDITEGSVGVTTITSNNEQVTSDTEVLASFTESGTAATAGSAEIVIEYIPDIG
jgi:hypothetical protein